MLCLTGVENELFQAIQDPVLVVTPDGIIIDANKAALNSLRKRICMKFSARGSAKLSMVVVRLTSNARWKIFCSPVPHALKKRRCLALAANIS